MLDLVSVIASFVANVISKRVSLKRFWIKKQRVYLQVVVVQSECGWGIGHANDGWIVVLAVQSTLKRSSCLKTTISLRFLMTNVI